MLHLTTFLYRRVRLSAPSGRSSLYLIASRFRPARLSEPAGRSHRRRRPATLYRVCRPSLAAPENHLSHPSPETPRRPPASRATAPFISRPRTASPIRLPRTASPIRFPRPRAVHLPPEQRPRSFPAREPPLPSVSRAPAPSTCRPRTPLSASRATTPAQPPHTRFFHESWKPIPACAPYLCGVRPRRASPSFRKTKLGAAAAGSSTADRRTKLLPSAFPAARIESAAPGRDFPETHVSDRSARRSRGRVAGLAGPGHGDVRALGGAAQETAPFDRRAPRRFPENSIPQPVTGPNRSFGPASACPYRRTAGPGIPASPQQPSSPPPSEGGGI